MSRILYMGGHSILEHDDLDLFHSIGHEVFSLGGYIDPAHPHDPKRPGLPQIPAYPELRAAVDALNQPDNLEAAKVNIPDVIFDWAEVVIVAALEWRWLLPQWWKLRNKRTIWRTIGQSSPGNEKLMAPLFGQGLEIVRYSPKERNITDYAGESAVIRFYKDPAEWHGWTGSTPVVTNVTQNLFQRAGACNADFAVAALTGLPVTLAGEGSEVVDGLGQISYPDMKQLLRDSRAYLYCGTLPAPYTLGFMEAAMTGIPIVSIGPNAWASQAHSEPEWLEAHEMAYVWSDDPKVARDRLRDLLNDPALAADASKTQQDIALSLFARADIERQWAEYLS